jgi:hypothetical protein
MTMIVRTTLKQESNGTWVCCDRHGTVLASGMDKRSVDQRGREKAREIERRQIELDDLRAMGADILNRSEVV